MSTEKENLEDFQGLARKYRITADKIEYILKKYGSVDEYIIRTISGEEKPEICSDGDALRENLNDFILINTSENKNWIATRIVQMCYWGMSGKGILTYDGEEVMQAFEKMSSREKKILAMFCDLHGTKYFPDKIRSVAGAMEVSEFIKITKNRKPDYGLRAYEPLGSEPPVESQLTRMYCHSASRKYCFPNPDELKKAVGFLEKLKKQIHIRTFASHSTLGMNESQEKRYQDIIDTFYKGNLVFVPDIEYASEPDSISHEEQQQLLMMLGEMQDARLEVVKRDSVDRLDLPPRVTNTLKRRGIELITQLKNLSDEEIMQIRGLGKDGFEYIKAKLSELEDPEIRKLREERDAQAEKVAQLRAQLQEAEKLLSSYDKIMNKTTHGKLENHECEIEE